MSKQKPLLFASDFQDSERFDPEFWEGRAADPSWIHGYSEIVQANDVAKADDLNFQVQQREHGSKFKTKDSVYAFIGAAPQELDVEFRWLPISNAGGGTLGADAARQLDLYTNRQGFRLATEDDLTSRGFRLTQAAHVDADGTIRRGPDTALYVRSGEVARKWERWMHEQAKKAEGQATLPDTFVDRSGQFDAPTIYEEERSKQDITH